MCSCISYTGSKEEMESELEEYVQREEDVNILVSDDISLVEEGQKLQGKKRKAKASKLI